MLAGLEGRLGGGTLRYLRVSRHAAGVCLPVYFPWVLKVYFGVFVGLDEERHTNSVHLRVLPQRVCGRLISTEIKSGAVNRGVVNYCLSLPLSE